MSNKTFDITIYDFDDICRTCLSREDLKPLYEKCFPLTDLAEMLITCTFVKFAEDDGLPMNICANCIYEINQSYSFAKRCETTDTILRKCVEIETPNVEGKEEMHMGMQENEVEHEEDVKIEFKEDTILPDVHQTMQEVLQDSGIKQEEDMKIELKEDIIFPDIYPQKRVKIKTELDNNFSQSQIAESIINTEDELRIEIRPESVFSNTQGVLENYKYVENFKEEEDAKIEFELNIISLNTHQRVEEVLENNVKVEYNSGETYDDPLDESYEEKDVENPEETYAEKSVNCSSTLSCQVSLDSQPKLQIKSDSRFVDNLTETGKKLYICSVCSKVYYHPKSLKYHMRLHTRENIHTCEICNKIFPQISLLKNHMRQHTGEKPYICVVCSKTFSQSCYLRKHMSIHTGKKPYSCKVCNKAFTQSNALNEHTRLHTGEKPYNCEICRKAFTQAGGFKQHMRTHTGEKPYRCKFCSKAFAQSHSFKMHMRLHTGEKPFHCQMCSMTFSQSNSLKRHIRLHTGEKPYNCEVCNEAFIQSSQLKIHMGLHTGVMCYKCEVCKKNFRRFKNFKLHMKLHTPEIPTTVKSGITILRKIFPLSSVL